MSDHPRDPAMSWLPNLVGGVSIWKLARDLNAPKFFDGRLLVPDTEGTDSLPTKVSWDVVGLLPLAEARLSHPTEVEAAVKHFAARLEAVAAELGDATSGFHDFKAAFTLPSLEVDGGAYYFYNPADKKLCAINWGASPRTLGGSEEIVFGYRDFARVVADGSRGGAAAAASGGPSTGAPGATAALVAAGAAAGPPGDGAKKEEEPKKEEKKPVAAGIALLWWHWLIIVLVILGILAWLYRGCAADADSGPIPGEDGGTPDASGVSADGMADARDGVGSRGDGGPRRGDGGDGREAGRDSAGDGPRDAMRDGLARDGGKDGRGAGDGGDASAASGADGGPGGIQGGVGGGSGVGVGVGVGGSGSGANALPHRAHFEPDAVKWRVVS